jgi:hypothetical protein
MEVEERAADPLAGGLMQGYQCGMLWGAALAAGAQSCRLLGSGPQAQAAALRTAQRIVETFRTQNKHIDCMEITEIDLSSPTTRMIVRFLLKSGARGSCLGMAARYAKAALREINTTLSEKPVKAPPAPVSCSALLAQKMGASEMHTAMVAGFAGGIGLSGSACGALGAAIWMSGMSSLNETGKTALETSAAGDTIERFLKCSGYEFECAKIVGRKFENVDDHAGYIRTGGCSQIIELLASQTPGK